MANRQKPRYLKLISGTNRADRGPPETPNESQPLDAVPEPPGWLPTPHGLREWQRLAPICVRMGTLTEGNVMLFAHFCAMHAKLVQQIEAGATPTGFLLSQVRAFASDFGLQSRALRTPTPAGGGPTTPQGRFDRFKRPPK